MPTTIRPVCGSGWEAGNGQVYKPLELPAIVATAVILAPLAVEVGAAAMANPAAATTIINGVAEASVGNALGGATLTTGVALTAKQAVNLARFEKKLPTGSTGVAVDQLGDGIAFTASVPGDVPGSQAVYPKTVDALGETTSYLKTTFNPRNDVTHIKDKLNPPAELPKY